MDTAITKIFFAMSTMKTRFVTTLLGVIIVSFFGIIIAFSFYSGCIGVKPPDNCLGWPFLFVPMFCFSHVSELHDAVWIFNLLRFGFGAGAIMIFLLMVWECTQSFWQALYIYYRKSEHVVIFGIGEKGYEIAQSILDKKTVTVVGVDVDEKNPNFLKLQAQGAFFFYQDMLDPKLFTKLGLERAAALYIVSGNDAVNIDVVSRLRKYMQKSKRQRRELLKVFVHVNNDFVRNLFWLKSQSDGDAPSSVRGATCIPFSVYNEAARFLFGKYSPDKVKLWDADEQYHLVVAGFGWLGQKIVLQAIQMGHFARRNPDGTASSDSLELAPKIRITVLDKNADMHRERFFSQYPVLDQNRCHEARFGGCTLMAHVEFVKQDILGLRELPELLTKPITNVFVCLADEVIALEAGKLLHSKLKLHVAGQTVVALQGESHLAEPMKSDLQAQGVEIEEVLKECCRLQENESYLGQNREEWAKKVCWLFSEQFTEEYKARLAQGEDKSTLMDERWNNVDEWERRSCYAVIDYAPITLRAAGITPDMSDCEMQMHLYLHLPSLRLLSKMAHDRWCAERFLDSWVHGNERDDPKRIHNYLIPFDKLPVDEQSKDDRTARFDLKFAISEKLW